MGKIVMCAALALLGCGALVEHEERAPSGAAGAGGEASEGGAGGDCQVDPNPCKRRKRSPGLPTK